MAAVDSLIRLITAQNADSLLLVSEQVPRLSRAGATRPLSMPPVGAAMMETFVAEVLTPEQIAEVQTAGSLSVEHGEFTATVKRQDSGWAMSFVKRVAAKSAAQSPAPVAVRDEPAPEPAAAPLPVDPPVPAAADARERTGGGVQRDARDLLERWLRRALAENASDLIVSSGRGARLRLQGGLVDLPGGSLADREIMALVERHLAEAHREALTLHGSTDFAMVLRDPGGVGETVRFRVNLFRQGHGLAAVFRPVRRHPPALADLNLPESLARLVRFPSGLVLVVGPTGAGKSTTLVALVEQLNGELPGHIITIEDPIEFEYQPQLALVHQRELGTHVDSFEAGLRAALREAPDVILLGEMRDRPTISAALTAAETGHLVLSSLHAGSSAMAIERVIDSFPEHQQRQVRGQLAGTLRAVLTQHLLPAQGGASLPAIELMIVNSAVASLIRDGKTHQLASAIQTGRDDGMIPLDRSLADLVEAGAVTVETAVAHTLDGGQQLRELLGGGGNYGGPGRARGRAVR
ncbi:MAG TPA: PilT/PilU family type 4a pilus ATPase [Kofleriaceae bacterium]|nr:PilT/PilU family type 4a pilus ATPase [Kofleriaceae bacterium]